MMKSMVINIETQTEDGKLVSLCHLNEKTIALETSDVANKVFKNNLDLFNKINQTTRITGGTLYRQEILNNPAGHNRIYSNVMTKFKHVETEISKLFFENNVLTKQIRAISKSGRKFDYDPTLVSENNTGGFFDEKNLSYDDIKSSQIICEVEEVDLFTADGIKTILITDHMSNKKSLQEVSYRMTLEVETNFKDYVDYVIRQSSDSILFLEKYINSIFVGQKYNEANHKFEDDYVEQIYSSLGIDNLQVLDISSKQIRQSDFGKVAISYYNLMQLMSNTEKSTYSSVLSIILPTSKTSPRTMEVFLVNYRAALESIRSHYYNTKSSKENKGKIMSKKMPRNIISGIATESFKIDQDILGYSIFSENQTGLNLFSTQDYKRRWAAEQAKYYPNITAGNDSKFLTSQEKARFSRIDNAAAFLTPVQLIMGNEKITTSRGMTNIPIHKIKEFRLAKSSRAEQQLSNNNPHSKSKAKINSGVLSSFNLEIKAPRQTLLTRAAEQSIDPLEDAKKYVGENSYFISNNPTNFSSTLKRITNVEDEKIFSIISDVVPRRFLRRDIAANSIKDLQISNPKSKTRSLITTKEISLENIPPHVKYMMGKEFNPNPNSDPLKNYESREIIEETQKNLFLVKALVGFDINEQGFLDLQKPIYKEMSQEILSSGRPIIGKAFDYEIPELGIVKDNFPGTIYSNLIYIRG